MVYYNNRDTRIIRRGGSKIEVVKILNGYENSGGNNFVQCYSMQNN